MDKDKHVQNIFKLAETLGSNKKKSETIIPTVNVVEEVPAQEVNTLPDSYLGINSIMIDSKSLQTKTSFLDNLSVDQSKYATSTFTPEEAGRIRKSMQRLSTGAASVVPLRCNGPQCSFAKTCPYQIENKAPIGQACLVEAQLVHVWMERYIEEFQADERSPTDMHMISRLCEYDIYDMRVTKYLAEHDQTLLTDFISSFDEMGNPIANKAISAAFEAKERIERMRAKTLKDLMATRDAKSKLAMTVLNTHESSTLSSIKAKVEELIRDRARIVEPDLKTVGK